MSTPYTPSNPRPPILPAQPGESLADEIRRETGCGLMEIRIALRFAEGDKQKALMHLERMNKYTI